MCPILPCPELPHQSYAAPVPIPANAATAPAAVNCSCGQCAPHMYNNHHLTVPSTLIVNRFTEINYFDNPPTITNLAEKFDFEMVSTRILFFVFPNVSNKRHLNMCVCVFVYCLLCLVTNFKLFETKFKIIYFFVFFVCILFLYIYSNRVYSEQKITNILKQIQIYQFYAQFTSRFL